MKHVTSYIFLIIAFLLLGVNGAAAQKEECPFTVTDVGFNTTISCDNNNKVLSIRSGDKVTITGNGNSTDWGIEIESLSNYLLVTIKDLNIKREGVPLKIKEGGKPFSIIIEGTNQFVSTGLSGTAGIEIEGSLSLYGSGSLTAIGAKGDVKTPGGAGIGGAATLTIEGGIIHAEGGAGAPGAAGISSGNTSIGGNAFVIAIDGVNTAGNPTITQIGSHTNGLFIRGRQEFDGSIMWASSALEGNVRLESNAEIPDWAEVTIADGQSLTVPDGITLTNNGTLTLEANGSIINNGTLSFGKYGKLNGSLGQINNNGGGEMVCDVEVVIVDIIGQPWTNIQGLNLYNTQKGKYDLNKAGSERHNLSSLPVISDGYELRIGYYPVGKKITIPFENRVTVKTIRLYFKIEDAKSVEVFRVPDQPVPPYEPEITKPGHTLKWYKDEQYSIPMTDADWENTENDLDGQIIYGRWESDTPPEPVDPEPVEPDPPYVPIYYSVYLPQVEGAATDPGPGEYDVESWSTFRFYLTLDTAYSQSQPIVTTDRGETLVPRTSDGAYLVKYVRTDVEIYIDGIEKNNPVANEPIRAADDLPQIWTERSLLCVQTATAEDVRVVTASGSLALTFRSVPGLNRRQLPTGIYIVQVGKTVRKVIVR